MGHVSMPSNYFSPGSEFWSQKYVLQITHLFIYYYCFLIILTIPSGFLWRKDTGSKNKAPVDEDDFMMTENTKKRVFFFTLLSSWRERKVERWKWGWQECRCVNHTTQRKEYKSSVSRKGKKMKYPKKMKKNRAKESFSLFTAIVCVYVSLSGSFHIFISISTLL